MLLNFPCRGGGNRSLCFQSLLNGSLAGGNTLHEDQEIVTVSCIYRYMKKPLGCKRSFEYDLLETLLALAVKRSVEYIFISNSGLTSAKMHICYFSLFVWCLEIDCGLYDILLMQRWCIQWTCQGHLYTCKKQLGAQRNKIDIYTKNYQYSLWLDEKAKNVFFNTVLNLAWSLLVILQKELDSFQDYSRQDCFVQTMKYKSWI